MGGPFVAVKKSVVEDVKKHAFQEARKHGHEIFGWLVGFFRNNEVYVVNQVKCTKYRKQSSVEAEADPALESEVASTYPRNMGLVGLYHSHPFRRDYHKPYADGLFESEMFHSEVDRATLRSRATREVNYLSAVTDGRNLTFFALDKDSKRVIQLKPEMFEAIGYDKFLTNYRANINLVFERKIEVRNIGEIVKGLESDLINYIYRNVSERDVGFERSSEKRWNVRLYAFEEETIADNVISMEKSGSSYQVNLRLKMKPEVFVTKKEEVLMAMREEIADNILYLVRKAFEPRRVGTGNVRLMELHLGNFKINKNELPEKAYIPPKRRMIMRKS